jgi:hypothetical protein
MVSTSCRRRIKAFYQVRVIFRGQGAAVCTKHKTILRKQSSEWDEKVPATCHVVRNEGSR